jgi:hypothetical protein
VLKRKFALQHLSCCSPRPAIARLLKMDDCMAMTHRYELEVRKLVTPEPVGYEGRRRGVAAVRQRGKRQDQYLDLAADDIVLDGWGLPFRMDTEGAGYGPATPVTTSSASRRRAASASKRRRFFPISDAAKAKIIVARTERTKCDDEGLELLYPDIDTHYAVIERFKAARV